MDIQTIVERIKRKFEDDCPYQGDLLPDNYDGWSFSDAQLERLIESVIVEVTEEKTVLSSEWLEEGKEV